MDKASFVHLVNLIKNDEVFVSTGRKSQRPPWYQLAVFLLRFGGATALRAAEEASVAEGSVFLYCDRVVKAFRRIRPQFLSWPDQQKRQVLKQRMVEYGFPGCIGMVDGSLIPLVVKPLKDGETYFCRKKFYAVGRTLFNFSSLAEYFSFRSFFKQFAMILPGLQSMILGGREVYKTQLCFESRASGYGGVNTLSMTNMFLQTKVCAWLNISMYHLTFRIAVIQPRLSVDKVYDTTFH